MDNQDTFKYMFVCFLTPERRTPQYCSDQGIWTGGGGGSTFIQAGIPGKLRKYCFSLLRANKDVSTRPLLIFLKYVHLYIFYIQSRMSVREIIRYVGYVRLFQCVYT